MKALGLGSSSGSGGGGSRSGGAVHTVNVSELQKATRLYTDMLNIQNRMTTAGNNQLNVLKQQYETRQKDYKQMTESAQRQATYSTQAQKALDRYQESVAKRQDKNDSAREKEELQRLQKEAQEQQRYLDNIAGKFAQTVGRFALNTLKNQWREAIDYTTQYYDALNEIRTVTMKTEDESNKMGENFRKMAKEMKVSSTEIASAAVTFYRQGLDDSAVNKRLEWVTKYAKVANIAFDDAAQLVTAAANSMSEDIQGDIQRIVDVFLYLGDAAATSGDGWAQILPPCRNRRGRHQNPLVTLLTH